MDGTKTCVLYRGLRENMKTFADRVAKKLDEMEKYDATIVYTGFLQDRISKANAAIILYRCFKTFEEDFEQTGDCYLQEVTICIAMGEPLRDGETENTKENLKGFIHLEQLPRLFGMLMQTIHTKQ